MRFERMSREHCREELRDAPHSYRKSRRLGRCGAPPQLDTRAECAATQSDGDVARHQPHESTFELATQTLGLRELGDAFGASSSVHGIDGSSSTHAMSDENLATAPKFARRVPAGAALACAP